MVNIFFNKRKEKDGRMLAGWWHYMWSFFYFCLFLCFHPSPPDPLGICITAFRKTPVFNKSYLFIISSGLYSGGLDSRSERLISLPIAMLFWLRVCLCFYSSTVHSFPPLSFRRVCGAHPTSDPDLGPSWSAASRAVTQEAHEELSGVWAAGNGSRTEWGHLAWLNVCDQLAVEVCWPRNSSKPQRVGPFGSSQKRAR